MSGENGDDAGKGEFTLSAASSEPPSAARARVAAASAARGGAAVKALKLAADAGFARDAKGTAWDDAGRPPLAALLGGRAALAGITGASRCIPCACGLGNVLGVISKK